MEKNEKSSPKTVEETTKFLSEGITAHEISRAPSIETRRQIQKVLLIDIPIMDEVDSPEEEILNAYWKAQSILSPPGYKDHMEATKYSRGLLTIGKVLQEKGVPTRYISVNDVTLDELDEAILWADMIGIAGSCTAFYPIMKAVSDRARLKNNEAVIILGGNHVTATDHQTLTNIPSADVIVRKEGEITVPELVDNSISLQDVEGISFRNAQNRIIRNKDRSRILGRDVPIPAYDLLPHHPQNYSYRLEATRGCPYKCAFCIDGVFTDHKITRITIEKTMEELLFLKDRLAPGAHLHFIDSIFTLNKKRMLHLLDEMRKHSLREHFSFSCDIRAKHADREMVAAMEEAGFSQVLIGLEDPNDEVLSKVGKGVRVQEDIETASLFKRHSGIAVTGYWVIGLPGSTHETLRRTIAAGRDFLQNGVLDNIDCAMFVPLPGTPIFEDPEQYGIELLGDEWGARYLRCQFDRAVYRNINGLNEIQIAKYYKLFVDTILQEYLKKLDMTLEELLNS